MEPRIEFLEETKLIGKKTIMSLADNKTMQLWQSFMPQKTKIENVINSELYSVEVYNDDTSFESFNPTTTFEKWAAVAVNSFESIPEGMDTHTLPTGQYAVFPYKGKASEAFGTYQYIYKNWLPNSEYMMDNRPHFALMGEKYKGEHPDSEEEFWIPIKKKS
ncbi:GyrI-like domain-containing protein [marine bacterium AO1-C]|nr:GyrI-like domain-containing protein [marine bacterium AO1-C]